MNKEEAIPKTNRTAVEQGLPSIAPDFAEGELVEQLDNIVPSRGYQMTPMVGLGGSAGGIQALTEFFKAMPSDSGMVFVVILHLSPTHHSTMAELLGRTTKMPVVEATDGQKVEPNHVYVIPPGKHITAVDGHLKLTDLVSERGKRVAVDFFFDPWPTRMARMRRRWCYPARMPMGRSASSGSRNEVDSQLPRIPRKPNMAGCPELPSTPA